MTPNLREDIAKIKELDAKHSSIKTGKQSALLWEEIYASVAYNCFDRTSDKVCLFDTIIQLAEDNARLVEALRYLVALKAVKEKDGKTEDYLRSVPDAWALAREALALHTKMMDGEKGE